MLMIRLLRTGKKHDPSFRVVVTDSRNAPQSGRFKEVLGSYNAQKGEPQFKTERIKHWISQGAQISDTVNNLLIKAKIIEGKKKDVLHHTRIKAKKEKNAPKAESSSPKPSPSQGEGGESVSTDEPGEVKKPLTTE